MTKIIKENELEYLSKIDDGRYGIVFNGIYNNKEICIKRYFDETLPDFYEEKRIIELTKICQKVDESIILPQKIIRKNTDTVGYISKLIKPCVNMHSFFKQEMTLEEKIEYLSSIKEKIQIMHNFGIIHCDLHENNILFDQNKNPYLIDFDNCTINNYETNKHMTSEIVDNYIYYNDVDKTVDIYLFNILTYKILNNVSEYTSIRNANNKEYGIFTSKSEQDICNCFGSFRKCNEYLIDEIKTRRLK